MEKWGEKLDKALLNHCEKITPHLNKSLYARPAWFILSRCTQRCKRLSPVRLTGGAVYSIIGSFFFHVVHSIAFHQGSNELQLWPSYFQILVRQHSCF